MRDSKAQFNGISTLRLRRRLCWLLFFTLLVVVWRDYDSPIAHPEMTDARAYVKNPDGSLSMYVVDGFEDKSFASVVTTEGKLLTLADSSVRVVLNSGEVFSTLTGRSGRPFRLRKN